MASRYSVPSVPKVHGQSPKKATTFVTTGGKVGLVGSSTSDSALNKSITYSMSKSHAPRNVKYATLSRGVRSEQLRRRSDASLRQETLKYGTQPRRLSVPHEVIKPRDTAVISHQQRSVVHSAATSKSPSKAAAITKQPRATSVPNPCSNVDLPVLEELNYDNLNSNYGHTYSGYRFPNDPGARDGLSSLSENVKSLVKLLYIPFRCCKNKV